jgi:PAS domain S-box-containing protein
MKPATLQTPEEIKKTEEKLLLIIKAIDSASDAIGISDAQGRHFYQNMAMTNLFGYATAEEMEANGGGATAVKDPEVAKEMFRNIMSGKPWSGELEMVTKSGRIFPAFERADAIKESDGNIIGLIGVITDITERKEAEKKIKESELKYRSLIENSSDAIFCVDEKGEYKFVNHLFATTFGKTPEYFEGKTFWDVYDKDNADYRFEATKRLFKTGVSESIEVEVPLPDKTLYFWATTNPIKDETGKVILNLTHAADITGLKQAKKELQNKMDELTIAYKQLEKYAFDNKELKQFTYVSSHQLQQPLRTIKNFVQILEEDYSGKFDENAIKYLNTIKDSAERMNALILALSDYSRLGLNKQLNKVDCRSIVNDVISDLDAMIKTSDAIIEVSKMPVLNAYEVELRQVFQNLLTNAIKFRKKNTQPIIQISSETFDGKWKFSVRDNGIGIAPDQFGKIFNLFQRLHSTEDEYEGKGIGLAFCKKVIELHQGKIWLESNKDQGVTFSFFITNLKL